MPRSEPLFVVHASSGVPIYRQLVDQVEALVAGGRLRPGDVVTSPTISLPAYSHGFVRFGNGGGNGLKAC